MSGWGIAETAPEIEKIKAESADYLNGLNSCGEIPWEVYDYAFDFYAELIQKAYELGKAEAEPHWIPVTEGLPDAYEGVLLTYKDEVTIGWHYNGAGAGWAIYEGEMSAGEGEVTAWMPLPEVYKGVTPCGQ